MKKIAMIISAAAVFAATPANAQRIAGASPRIEVKVGYDELAANYRLDDSALIEDDRHGRVGIGLEAGVDQAVGGNLVLGAYVGYDFPRINECGEELFFTGDRICVRNKRNLSAGLRAGLQLGEGGLIYVKGGYSDTKIRSTYTRTGSTAFTFNDSDKTNGWQAGAGFEVPVSGGLYVKGEYVHTRYENVHEGVLAATDRINPSRHQIMGGVGIRFGGR
jgi:outer membrane immunogenic protein